MSRQHYEREQLGSHLGEHRYGSAEHVAAAYRLHLGAHNTPQALTDAALASVVALLEEQRARMQAEAAMGIPAEMERLEADKAAAVAVLEELIAHAKRVRDDSKGLHKGDLVRAASKALPPLEHEVRELKAWRPLPSMVRDAFPGSWPSLDVTLAGCKAELAVRQRRQAARDEEILDVLRRRGMSI
jgi:hypothetical protein